MRILITKNRNLQNETEHPGMIMNIIEAGYFKNRPQEHKILAFFRLIQPSIETFEENCVNKRRKKISLTRPNHTHL